MGHDFAAEQDPATLSEEKQCSTKPIVWGGGPSDEDPETKLFGTPPTSAAQTNVGAPPLPADLQNHPRYQILDFLGAGGMGVVFKARHRRTGELVALKMIHPSWADEPAMVARFRGEIRTVARLSHPNIVVAREAERVGAMDVLVMEYVKGTNLEQLLTRQRAPRVAQACEYVRQASFGLQHVHEQGMVHRDLKPQNLMLTAQGRIKILDFGLARFTAESKVQPSASMELADMPSNRPDALSQLLNDDATPHWRGRRLEEMAAGYPLGSVDYLAPEEVDDPRRVDIRADIYSLGCTLYRLLTGRVPFVGGRLVEKLKAHKHRMATPVDELCPAVGPELARLVARMMAKDPADRHPDPAALAQALAPFSDA